MIFLTKEQVDDLNYRECLQARKQLEEAFPFDTHVGELTREQWANADLAANTLIWLEDRIDLYEDVRVTTMNPDDELEDLDIDTDIETD
jgi:hypothetical protein